MMGKTHLVMGIAAAMAVLQPHSYPGFAAAAVGGAIGGIMADVDMKLNHSSRHSKKRDVLYTRLAAMVLAVSVLMGDFFRGGRIYCFLLENWMRSAMGVAGFFVLAVIGACCPHRGATHSLLFLALFTLAAAQINPSIGTAFFLGYASHIGMDLLNKSPVKLLYPMKKGFCLKLCHADGFANELLFFVGVGVIAAYLATVRLWH